MANDQKHTLSDDTIARGEHMDLGVMDEALQAEIDAGAPNPTGFIESRPSAKMNPYLTEDDQGMDMEPKAFGPPQYGSPNPESAAGRLTTLEDGHPFDGLGDSEVGISDDYAVGLDGMHGTSDAGGADADVDNDDDSDEINATDGAKELAQEKNIDLNKVQGTGENGRIQKPDVQDYIDATEANATVEAFALATGNDVDLSGVQGTGEDGVIIADDVQKVIAGSGNNN